MWDNYSKAQKELQMAERECCEGKSGKKKQR